MSDRVVVLGAGYAGCTAVKTLEGRLDDHDLHWISAADEHLVRHEVHRLIRDPGRRDAITVPVADVAGPTTTFTRATVTGLDPDARTIILEDAESIAYDALLVAIGSETAFYGIPGLEAHAHTLTGAEEAIALHEAIRDADDPTGEPIEVVVGGAGLSGVQAAGEVAVLRDRAGLDLEVTLVEALPEILPRADPAVRRRVGRLLRDRSISVLTDDPIVAAGPTAVEFADRSDRRFDVLVWTGGITGRPAVAGSPLERDQGRLVTDATFETNDERVFAVGDAARVGVDGDPAPPTAQAAWDAAGVAAENLARRIEGRPLRRWEYRDKGTLVSVGEAAVAHDVAYLPAGTFGGPAARFLKKFVAARWLASITSWRRGLAAWEAL